MGVKSKRYGEFTLNKNYDGSMELITPRRKFHIGSKESLALQNEMHDLCRKCDSRNQRDGVIYGVLACWVAEQDWRRKQRRAA